MSKIKWFGSVVAVLLFALAVGGPAFAGKGNGKGKGNGGGGGGDDGGGDPVPPSVIYFLADDQQAYMDQDGNGVTFLNANVENGTPSAKFHNGSAWFVLIRPVAGTYPNGVPRKEVFVVRADGAVTVQLTDDPHFEPMWKIQPPRWASDGAVVDGKVSFMGWSYDAAGQVVDAGIYTQQVAFDLNDNPVGPLNGRKLAVSLGLDDDGEPNSEVHSWSPDGSEVVYDYDRDFVFVDDLTTNTSTLLSSGVQPAWAPNGNKIAFRVNGGISTINPDGSGQTEIVPEGSSKRTLRGRFDPAWSPDSTHIVYRLLESPKKSGGLRSNLLRVTASGGSSTVLTGSVSDDLRLIPNAWRE